MATGAITLWVLGLLSYFLRRFPNHLFQFIQRRFVVSVMINASSLNDMANMMLLESFYEWFMKGPHSKQSRNFLLEPPAAERGTSRLDHTKIGERKLTPGLGTQFIVFEGRIGWFKRGKPETSDNQVSPNQLVISFFGRDPGIVQRLIDSVKPPADVDKVYIYGLTISRGSRRDWDVINQRHKRTIGSVILAKDQKEQIIRDIVTFEEEQCWYHEHGINHKQVFLLTGDPGTGKSSLVFALASHFNRPVYIFNLNAVNDADFASVITRVPVGAYILFEDIDASDAVSDRGVDEEGENIPKPSKESRVSLSSILNAFDGVSSISGNTVFITTNHIENLDPALIRKGRVDYIYEILPLSDTEVRAYIEQAFPGTDPGTEKFEDITGADLQALLLIHRRDPEAFVGSIPLKGSDIFETVKGLFFDINSD